MKILFTGGGSGGHFYPIIAVIQSLNKVIDKEKIVDSKIYYFSDSPYNERALFENGVIYQHIPAGKLRRYFSVRNFFDIFKTILGIIRAFINVYAVYPDVVFGKGGYASFPTLLAAKILRIPVFIHESDSVPGRTNMWASKFAKRIAISYEGASNYFPKEKTVYTGQPVREEILVPIEEGASSYLNLDPSLPTILIICGSQGAELINNVVLDALPDLVTKYQIIHQTGNNNIENVEKLSKVILENSNYKERYRPFGYLNALSVRMSAGISSLVVSRAGSTMFEIAAWKLPSIVIPITDSNGDHQRKNAFNYARAGACTVIEESNLSPSVLKAAIEKLMGNKELLKTMSVAAGKFYQPNAAETIARGIVEMALEHESS
ncbi:MAG: UDP-N-acetylglucosamine--N-acetylmuramyl-(pentapeptide) pyrophosphoryl-undecaprenol N-acetylglucosamine transferase [Patescibacteria group bacterium]